MVSSTLESVLQLFCMILSCKEPFSTHKISIKIKNMLVLSILTTAFVFHHRTGISFSAQLKKTNPPPPKKRNHLSLQYLFNETTQHNWLKLFWNYPHYHTLPHIKLKYKLCQGDPDCSIMSLELQSTA